MVGESDFVDLLIPCVAVYVLPGLQGDTGKPGPSAECSCSQGQTPERLLDRVQTVSLTHRLTAVFFNVHFILKSEEADLQVSRRSCLEELKNRFSSVVCSVQAYTSLSPDLYCRWRETDEEAAGAERHGAADRQTGSVHLL